MLTQSSHILAFLAEILAAESAQQATERLAAWASRWREQAPQAVATFQGEFEATLGYYQLEGLPRSWVRSTLLLERVNRQLLGISSSGAGFWKSQRCRGSSLSSNPTASCSMG